ncbi:glycoside hydrolase family 5 protein [Mycena belliarum]|uniref:Glycoside hydrolase family 5 protein n=1 Tax=Mycena belliarum TaxID=1033014 RepID=A0AAD6XSH9_9AGAR|nr:glycoside hydrolase family 5 protein [Mycena belliae]
MHKITSKFAAGFHKRVGSSGRPAPHLGSIESSIYQYRKQRGVNLGSWFVLERWITDAPFRHAEPPAQSDLDVARGAHAKQVLEAHYDNWITESDWAWISELGLNTVRIPIGYYHLCGADPSVLVGTDFANYGEVFCGVWPRLIKAIETAERFGLGVLLDLHAAPGKQNNDAHAGTSNPPAFFSEKRHRAHTIHVLRTLVSQLNAHTPRLANVVGIELLNEPHPIADQELQKWYSAAIKDISALDPALPIYLSDCWKTEQYAEYIKSTPQQSLVVLDHHLCRCFTASDISTTAPAHARALTDAGAQTPRMFAHVAEMLDAAGAGFVVGEWSGALNPGSLTGAPDDAKNYVAAQLRLYETHCAGNFFWTYKKQGGPDHGWCLRDAVAAGVFPSQVALVVTKSGEGDRERQMRTRDTLKDAASEHIAYWSQFPGKYEHARFADGFVQGWDDAYSFFFASGGRHVSELGFVGAWARRKTKDHGPGFWESLHGFKQGVAAARKDFQEFYCSG